MSVSTQLDKEIEKDECLLNLLKSRFPNDDYKIDDLKENPGLDLVLDYSRQFEIINNKINITKIMPKLNPHILKLILEHTNATLEIVIQDYKINKFDMIKLFTFINANTVLQKLTLHLYNSDIFVHVFDLLENTSLQKLDIVCDDDNLKNKVNSIITNNIKQKKE